MKLLVESYLGLGDAINATPLCHALHLLGHDVDFYLNSAQAGRMAALFAGWPVLGRVIVRSDDIDYGAYDLGISARGRYSLQARFPPGLCLCVHDLDIKRRNQWMTEAVLRPARLLGYDGPVPAAVVRRSPRRFDLPAGTIVVHAGSRPGDLRKRWAHWPVVCARLQARGRHVAIVGTGADRSADGWEVAFQPMFDLPLQDLAALLDQASFFLGHDTGIGHLAAAVGLPGLMLFGPTNHHVFRPNSAVMRVVAANPGPDRRARADMSRLTIEGVWQEIEALLADPRRDPPRALPPRAERPVPVPLGPWPAPEACDRDTYPMHVLEHVFTQSADLLMRGRDRRSIARLARRPAARAHRLQTSLLLRQQLRSLGSLSRGALDLARDHARCAMDAGQRIRGAVLLAALWLLRRLASLQHRRRILAGS